MKTKNLPVGFRLQYKRIDLTKETIEELSAQSYSLPLVKPSPSVEILQG